MSTDPHDTLATARVTDAVIKVLATVLNREPASIAPRTRLFDDLAFDSTSILELLMALEDELGVEFDPDVLEPEDFETVSALASHAVGLLEQPE
ncbi:acyl carrier protein [Kitasatospora sp. NPDC057542]|uniref:acyl carrier protein n=1 Tax=Streptomycetaceae TaxID=2062 RepID=UPI001CCA5C55|nr:acyl carrier protein [Streptomyces sp. LS1784]